MIDVRSNLAVLVVIIEQDSNLVLLAALNRVLDLVAPAVDAFVLLGLGMARTFLYLRSVGQFDGFHSLVLHLRRHLILEMVEVQQVATWVRGSERAEAVGGGKCRRRRLKLPMLHVSLLFVHLRLVKSQVNVLLGLLQLRDPLVVLEVHPSTAAIEVVVVLGACQLNFRGRFGVVYAEVRLPVHSLDLT